jgi:anaphase-promoting complex subunit 6
VGCYYYCIRQFDHARRYFCKATTLEGSFAPAWLGFGNAYAAQDESDQAMAAYRTAARLFAGYYIGFVLYYLWVHNGLWRISTFQNFFELL